MTHAAKKNVKKPSKAKPEKKDADAAVSFWRKPLAELTQSEWEQLCDGCGRCCLIKLEDEDSGRIWSTSVACRLFDAHSCRCADYAKRSDRVADCLRLTIDLIPTLSWLPPSCAYKLRYAGEDLPKWHPLLTGDPQSTHAAGASVLGRVQALEDEVAEEDLPKYIADWPTRRPRARPRRKENGD